MPTLDTFARSVEAELRLAGHPFDRAALWAYVASCWPLLLNDPDPVRWAGSSWRTSRRRRMASRRPDRFTSSCPCPPSPGSGPRRSRLSPCAGLTAAPWFGPHKRARKPSDQLDRPDGLPVVAGRASGAVMRWNRHPYEPGKPMPNSKRPFFTRTYFQSFGACLSGRDAPRLCRRSGRRLADRSG